MSINWVMLRDNGDIVRLRGETIRHKTPKISFELTVPKSLQSGRPPFSFKSDTGTAYITTYRLIYIPAKQTEEFKSFHAWLADCQDSYAGSPLFGAWYWTSTVKPITGGNIPPEIPRLEVKFTFTGGGHSEFASRFEAQKELVDHARQVQQATGQNTIIPDEPLPAYEANGSQVPTSPPPGASIGRSTSSASQNPPPNEPPPGYDEAQAQNLSDRLETHVRHEAERS